MQQLTLLPLSLVVLLAFVMRRVEGSWLGPCAIFGLYWSGFLSLTYVLLPDFTLTFFGVLWIVFAYGALIAGATLGSRRSSEHRPELIAGHHAIVRGEPKLLQLLVVGCALLALAATPFLTAAAGVAPSELTSAGNFVQVAAFYTSNRYNDPAFREPAMGIALYSFAYVGSILGGRMFVLARTWGAKIFALLPLMAAGFLALLMTTRALVLLSLLLWLSGYLISNAMRGPAERQLMSIRKLGLFLFFCAIALGLFVAGQLVRAGDADKVARNDIYASVATSFMGSTSTFTTWFDETSWGQLPAYGWGTRTLSGPLNWVLPDFDRASIATFDPIVVGGGSALGEDTTVATLFRELIYDFTPAGSLLLFAALGVYGARAWRRCVSYGLRGSAALSIYYLIVLYSMMGFVYKFTTLIAVSLGFTAYCRLIGTRFRADSPQANAGLNRVVYR